MPFGAIAQSTNCLTFDGADDLVTAPNTALNAIGLGDFTIEAWVRGEEALQVEHPRMLANIPGFGAGLLFFFHGLWGGSTVKMLAVQIEGTNYFALDNGTLGATLLDGTCHHVAVARNADTLHFFADGIEFGTRVIFTTNPTVTSASSTLWIGNDDGAGYGFNGNISQLRIWNRARTAAEIQAQMGMSLPGTTPDLVAYWELNDGGQVILDRTGTADGQLGATAAAESSDATWVSDCCSVSGVGVEEEDDGAAFSIHPNPARDLLWIEHGANAEAVHVLITDALGRTVLEAEGRGDGRMTVNVSGWTTGVYCIAVSTHDSTHSSRFLKE